MIVKYERVGWSVIGKGKLSRTSCVVIAMAARGRMRQSSWPSVRNSLGGTTYVFGCATSVDERG